MRIVQTLSTPALCALLLGVLEPGVASAQLNEPPPPAAYALTGVTIMSADGAPRANVTIVIRGGLIEAIGGDIQVPPDAELLEGDSLMVYSGIIDAQGEASVEFPEADADRSDLAFWAPPREAQGLTPHRRAADYLTDTGEDFEQQRRSGIVGAAILPDGPLMPGRGLVLLLRKGAATPAGLVLVPELGPSMALRGARGMYPSTVFGAVAVIRQSLEDARHHGLLLAAHERDPRGMKAPAWDPDWDVLREAMAGQVRVFFRADEAADIRTVLAMAREYELRPVIVGGAEAWKVADELLALEVTVLVSLDFPEPERWEPKETSDTAAQAEPLDAAAAREKQNLEERYANAARLAQVGVTFALTSGGGEADLLEGARKSIEYGLAEAQALAALTAVPASLFGVEYVVRIESGMPASLVVTDGPLFGEDTKILYTFVEGELERGKEAKKPAEEPTVDVTGTWTISIDLGGEILRGTMNLTQEGAEFSGTMELDVGTVRVREGLVSGNEVTFETVYEDVGQTATSEVTGTVEGDEAGGSGRGEGGRFTWKATRSGPPQEVLR